MKTLLITILLSSTIILVGCGNNEIKKEVVVNTGTTMKEVISSGNLIDIGAAVEQFKNNTGIIDNNEVIGTGITDINKDIVKSYSGVLQPSYPIIKNPTKYKTYKGYYSDKMESVNLNEMDFINDEEMSKIIDKKTFKKFSNSYYYKDKNNVYFLGHGQKIIEGAIPQIIEGASPQTYKVILSHKGGIGLCDYGGTDGSNLFINGNKVETGDLQSYMLTTCEDDFAVSGDKNNLYLRGWTLPGGDINSIIFLGGGGYFKDKNFVYFPFWLGFDSIKGADPKTFEIIDQYFTKDKYGVYNVGKRIEGIKDIGTFTIKDGVAQDSKCIYEKQDYYLYICKEK